jgi:hypothetical protein
VNLIFTASSAISSNGNSLTEHLKYQSSISKGGPNFFFHCFRCLVSLRLGNSWGLNLDVDELGLQCPKFRPGFPGFLTSQAFDAVLVEDEEISNPLAFRRASRCTIAAATLSSGPPEVREERRVESSPPTGCGGVGKEQASTGDATTSMVEAGMAMNVVGSRAERTEA